MMQHSINMYWATSVPGKVFGVDGSAHGKIISIVVPAPHGCDLACPFCYISKQRQEDGTLNMGSLNATQYKMFIDKVCPLDATSVVCGQGYECLLPGSWDDYMVPIYSWCNAQKTSSGDPRFEMTVLTNGTHLAQRAKHLAAMNLKLLVVSVDSSDPNVHDRTRGKKGAFKDTMHGIDIALEYPTLRSVLVVTSVLMPGKKDRLVGMPQLLASRGIKNWNINALIRIPSEGYGAPFGDHSAVFRDLFELNQEAQKHGITLSVDDEFDQLKPETEHLDPAQVRALRVKRLTDPEKVMRLTPDGGVDIGFDIMKRASRKNAPKWSGLREPKSFLASLSPSAF